MKQVISILFISLLFGRAYSSTETVNVHDHEYPSQFEDHSVTWTLAGTHHFKYKIFFSVFTAALYQPEEGEGTSLRFTYTRKLKADDLRELAMKTLKAQNDSETLENYQTLTDEIQESYQDVKPGDAYTITVVPEKGTWLYLNDQEVFFTENAEFGEWYLNIWLGNPPASEDLKTALLKDSAP